MKKGGRSSDLKGDSGNFRCASLLPYFDNIWGGDTSVYKRGRDANGWMQDSGGGSSGSVQTRGV